MDLHVQCSGHHLMYKLSLPKLLILNYVCVSVSVAKINIEVFDLFGDLLLKTALLFIYLYYALVRVPISLDVL